MPISSFGKPKQVFKSTLVLSLLISLAGCDVPPEAKPWVDRAEKEIKISLVILLKQLGVGDGSESPQPQVSASPSPGLNSSNAAMRAKANAELLREILLVALQKEPKDPAEFGNWVDTLNQGASLEGVYNGLTHSTEFRALEEANKGALPEALKAFGQELALLEAELPVVTQFDARSALPLPVMGTVPSEGGTPGGSNSRDPAQEVHGAKTLDGNAEKKPPVDVNVLAEQYSKQFVGASIFTLKRVIGDEALKVIAIKSEYREKLALWYSKWVVHMSQLNVDFGVPLRNKPDETMHYKWVLDNSNDRVMWEVLNRLHRVLNEANRQKQ